MSSRTGIALIGPALRHLRVARQVQQREAARRAALPASMLSAFERGRRRPSLASLDKVLAALGAHLVDLANAVRRLERGDFATAGRGEEKSP